jgi:microsomal dipeptidase-like Zn-dependent dipeptidase
MKALLFRRGLTGRVWQPAGIRGEMNPLSVRTSFDKLQAGGVDVLLSTVYAPEQRLLNDIHVLKLIPLRYARYLPFSFARHLWRNFVEPTYFEVTTGMLDGMEEQVATYNEKRTPGQREARVVHSAEELKAIVDQGRDGPIAFVHNVEGAHSLEGSISRQHEGKAWQELTSEVQDQIGNEILENLETLHKKGVAYLILAHFYPNRLIASTFPYPEHVALSQIREEDLLRLRRDWPLTAGLTALGRQVVQRMIELGMIIDVSHATPTARREIYELVEASGREAPIVMATHVGAYGLNPSPYNLEDWEIEWLGRHGGVVGVIFMTYWLMPHETKFGLNAISRHMEYLAQVGTDRVVAIGTDFDGADPPDDIDDAAQLPILTRRLMAEYRSPHERKYTDEQIKRFLGGNALRFLLEAWRPANGR